MKNMDTPKRTLLYIDMAYTVEMVKSKNHDEFLQSRHGNGYFHKVWGLHPLSDIADGTIKKPKIIQFSPDQVIIEGVAQAMPWPKFLLPLNFLVSQIKLMRQMVRVVRENNISVIVSTDPLYGGLFGLGLKKLCRKPLGIYVYMNYDEIYEDTGKVAMPRLFPWRFLEKFIFRFVFSRADLVAGGNKNNMRCAIDNGANKETATVFPVSKNMYKGHLLAPAERVGSEDLFARLNIPLNRHYLLFVGRLLDLKRPDDALRAMKIIIDENPSVIGLLAGEGPMRPQLEGMIADFGLEKNVLLLGNIDQESLSLVIPKCVVLSPLTGMALIECGLGGAPIVAYDRDWQADFIQDGENGFIVGFKDYAAMAHKAIEILKTPALKDRFSANIRITALSYADPQKLYAHEHKVFEEMFVAYERKHNRSKAKN